MDGWARNSRHQTAEFGRVIWCYTQGHVTIVPHDIAY